jgi:hypothetical protein
MSPKKVDMLLGSADRVTPFLGGIALAKRWKVPDTNLFIRKQVHFCEALSLSHDAAPLQRFADLLLQTQGELLSGGTCFRSIASRRTI